MNKKFSIKKNFQFKYILKNGEKVYTSFFNIYISKNKCDVNRIGIAIKREIKGSVKRNYLKRIIRNSYYKIREDLKKGYNIVFVVKEICKDNPEFNLNSCTKAMENSFKKLNLFTNKDE